MIVWCRCWLPSFERASIHGWLTLHETAEEEDKRAAGRAAGSPNEKEPRRAVRAGAGGREGGSDLGGWKG